MEVKFICPTWGMDKSNVSPVISQIKNAGYDGVEIGFSIKEYQKQTEILQAAKNEGLFVIAQHYDTEKENFKEHLDCYAEHLYLLASLKPYFINAQTGKDYFSFEENCEVLEKSFSIEKETGVKIVHETHRGKFSYGIDILNKYLDHFPELRITADFSHYCVGSESFLQSKRQKQWIKNAIERTDHIHARVGHTQSPQVNDPKAEEWQEALNYHLQWWDTIIEKNKDKEIFTITPEFGPYPYMQELPYTRKPVSSQWEINIFMKDLLKQRYVKS